jgi:hypothetical protein
MNKFSATKTFPVRKPFSRIQTAAVWTTDSSPEDFCDVVAVVEYVFIENERGTKIVWWNAERRGYRWRRATEEGWKVSYIVWCLSVHLDLSVFYDGATFQNAGQVSVKHIHPC